LNEGADHDESICDEDDVETEDGDEKSQHGERESETFLHKTGLMPKQAARALSLYPKGR
jgi:hypothetical protein